MEFRWNQWNQEHVQKHGVKPGEPESVVRRAMTPYPQHREDKKWLVIGRGLHGRWLQVVYILDDDESVFIIHARPLTDREKRRHRRRIGG